MNKWFYPLLALLLGLFIAQTIAIVQVYLSNTQLYHTLVIIKDTGYLPVPNEQIMPHLREFGPAFFGGIFFTLTVGAGLSLLALSAVWTWDRLFQRKRSVLCLYLIPWFGALILANYQGFSPMVTLYFLFVPLAVFGAVSKWMPPQTKKGVWPNRITHGAPLVLLAILWTSQMDNHLFLNLRDSLLLSNPFGSKVNDLYYDYTLYPAEVFKALGQKTIKSCAHENIKNKSLEQALEKQLIGHDYLCVDTDQVVDLMILAQGGELVFQNRGRSILRTSQTDFLAHPDTVLSEFSLKSDRFAFFRQFTFFSLLIGFPIVLYIFFYTLIRLTLGALLNSGPSSVSASALCFIAGAGLLAIFSMGGEGTARSEDLKEAIQSERLGDRIAALKTIEEKKLEISSYQVYPQLLKSPHIAERYWLARTLRFSKRPETYKDLMALTDDPHRNVINMAFYALGQRGDKRSINDILNRIKTSTDWYSQRYAYNALRALGWKQERYK